MIKGVLFCTIWQRRRPSRGEELDSAVWKGLPGPTRGNDSSGGKCPHDLKAVWGSFWPFQGGKGLCKRIVGTIMAFSGAGILGEAPLLHEALADLADAQRLAKRAAPEWRSGSYAIGRVNIKM